MSFSRKFVLNAGAAMLFGATCLAAPAWASGVAVAHAKGETVLPATPSKVAVFDLAALDILNALGVEAVAGVPKGASANGNFPPRIAKFGDAKYQNVGTLFEPDRAALTALKPDLILIGGRSAKKYDALKDIAPTIDLSADDKNIAALAINNTRKLGRIFNVADRAEKRVAEFEALLAALHAEGGKAGTGLLLFAAGQGVTVHAPGDRFGHVYDFVGIRSAVAPAVSAPAPSPRPAAGSPEAAAAKQKQQAIVASALATQPDWIFVLDRTAATGSAPSTIRERLVADEAIASTSAWKAGRVVYLDPKTWYIVGAGIDALSEDARSIVASLRAKTR